MLEDPLRRLVYGFCTLILTYAYPLKGTTMGLVLCRVYMWFFMMTLLPILSFICKDSYVLDYSLLSHLVLVYTYDLFKMSSDYFRRAGAS